MMKKFLSAVTVSILLIFSLSGCAKCISTETSTVQVKIVDEYYRGVRYNPATKMTQPSEHRITIEYNDVEYYIYGSETYHKYSDKVGEYTNGTLETKKYDDGTERYNIIGLE